jgi:glycosyltransferase involved in cell wall biosynthesis
MPVYNARRYLVEAVQSVLSQSLDDFELIAVEDGSSDGSGRILRRFAGRDRRIRIISRGNTGIVQALNDALKQARGEFLARMDADDVSLPTRFDLQVQFLRAHPEVVAVGSHVELIDPYGVIFPDKWQPRLALEHDGIEADLLRGNGWALIHPSVMMRRADVEAIGGYRREFQHAEDIDLYLRLAERGKLANLPEVLHRYRQHLGSVNRVHRDRQIEIITAIVKDAHQRRGTTMPPNWKLEWPEMPGRWKQHCDWAWHALKSGQAPAARKHALNALRAQPLNRDSWRLIFCAIRGR